MKKSRYGGVYTDGKNYYTCSAHGKSVYGERIIKGKNCYYRLWNPWRSKLSSCMHLKLKTFPFQNKKILYLGAATGTTVSHISDISKTVWAVELSPISMSKLVALAKSRKNIYPILNDARHPEEYSIFVDSPDIIYQDISQRDQVSIFIKNMDFFNAEIGFLMLKTRTIDIRKKTREILKIAKRKIEENYNIVEIIDIGKYQKEHYAIVVKK